MILKFVQGSGDQSPKRLHKSTTQVKNRYMGNQTQNGLLSKQDGVGNGITHTDEVNAIYSKTEPKSSISQGKEKVMACCVLCFASVLDSDTSNSKIYTVFFGFLGCITC